MRFESYDYLIKPSSLVLQFEMYLVVNLMMVINNVDFSNLYNNEIRIF